MVSAFERGALPSFEINGEDGNNYGNPRLFLRYSSVLSRLLDYGRPEVYIPLQLSISPLTVTCLV